jgi:L-seryl-tRNA(Ser) seleniumtransferase
VERVIASEDAQPLIVEYGRTQVLAAIRATLDGWRREAQAGTLKRRERQRRRRAVFHRPRDRRSTTCRRAQARCAPCSI